MQWPNEMCILFRTFNKNRLCNVQAKCVSCLDPLTRTDNAMAKRNVYPVEALIQEQTMQSPIEMCMLFRHYNNRQCNGQTKCVLCLGPLVFLLPKTCLALRVLDEGYIQKRAVCTKFDIYCVIPQHTKQKIKDWTTRTLQQPEVTSGAPDGHVVTAPPFVLTLFALYKGNNKITELRTIFQRESQNS